MLRNRNITLNEEESMSNDENKKKISEKNDVNPC
jgi:hypothetical protein